MNFILRLVGLGLLALTFSTTILSFSASRFENETCPQTLHDRGNGYYSVRSPLVFQGDDTYGLQQVNGPEGTFYQVYNSQMTFTLEGDIASVEDFVVYQEDLWVLTDGNLIQFNSSGKILNRFRYPQGEKREKPVGLEVYEGNLYIAHGSLGLISFNLRKQSFSFIDPVNTWQEDGRRSMAVGLTITEGKVFVALSGLNQGAFNGIVVFDLGRKKTINMANYRNGREGVIDPRAKVYSENGDIFLNNGGWIHRLVINDLLNRSNAKPYWMAIPHQSGDLNRFLMIRGDFIFSGGEIIGCAINERTPILARRQL